MGVTSGSNQRRETNTRKEREKGDWFSKDCGQRLQDQKKGSTPKLQKGVFDRKSSLGSDHPGKANRASQFVVYGWRQ